MKRTHNDVPLVVHWLFQMCLCITKTHSQDKAKDPKILESSIEVCLNMSWDVLTQQRWQECKLTISNAHN